MTTNLMRRSLRTHNGLPGLLIAIALATGALVATTSPTGAQIPVEILCGGKIANIINWDGGST